VHPLEERNFLMDEKDIRWQNCSEKNHDNNQLGGRASPMYLDKYFFPFVLLFLSLLVKKRDAKLKTNKNLSLCYI
jgi:hypothetical protein